mmetsp:Transcript_7435/g.17676  ORF Transcript_7435/g.17676 Transcript_7435/m.17676 type:complete len:157 (+) Transcript_7435:60-530(+)
MPTRAKPNGIMASAPQNASSLITLVALAAAMLAFRDWCFIGAPQLVETGRRASGLASRLATARMEDKVLEISEMDNDPVARAGAMLNSLSEEETKYMVELLDAPTVQALLGTRPSPGTATTRQPGSQEKEDKATQKILGYILIAIGFGVLFLVFTR